MKVLDPGHDYLVEGYDGAGPQRITFLKRVGEGYPFNELPTYGGTNCQEVLRVLIDRVEYLESQNQAMGKHDDENDGILTKLKDAVWLFERRAARNHHRDFPYSIYHPDDAYRFPTGPDGHIQLDLFQPLVDEAYGYQPWKVDGDQQKETV